MKLQNDDFFYDSLTPMKNFEDINDMAFFAEPPKEWYVIVSDIQGSTQAVKEGRYKDVNLIGASVIALVSNYTKKYNTISVFGGDGATLLLPKNTWNALKKEMCGLIQLSKSEFNINLRIGAVAVEVLKDHKKPIFVGKYKMSETTYLAQLAGEGVSYAEYLIKNKSDLAEILNDQVTMPESPNLSGLSCRMEHFQNSNGQILSIIVKPKNSENENWLRTVLIFKLKEILNNNFEQCNPVKLTTARWPLIPFISLRNEIKAQSKSWTNSFFVFLKSMMGHLMVKFNISAGGFDALKYKQELSLQSDFHKFDDNLRLVVDCTDQQALQLQQILERSYQEGRIFYGLHKSQKAVVTCFVQSAARGEHIHYVDGEGGGYSLASIQLKKQIAANQ